MMYLSKLLQGRYDIHSNTAYHRECLANSMRDHKPIIMWMSHHHTMHENKNKHCAKQFLRNDNYLRAIYAFNSRTK